MIFACRLRNDDRSVSLQETFEAEGLRAACDEACRRLEARPDCSAAELWVGGRMLARFAPQPA